MKARTHMNNTRRMKEEMQITDGFYLPFSTAIPVVLEFHLPSFNIVYIYIYICWRFLQFIVKFSYYEEVRELVVVLLIIDLFTKSV